MLSVVIGQAPISYDPLSVPVSPSPVSREASRDFVALDMWLRTRYQIPKINVCRHIVYLVYFCVGVWIGWFGYKFLLSGFGERNNVIPHIILF